MEIENKVSSVTGLVAALNTKATEIVDEIPDITNLAFKGALSTKTVKIKNKMPDITSFINTPEFHKLTKISFDARTKTAVKNLVSKGEVKNALDLGEINREKTSNI